MNKKIILSIAIFYSLAVFVVAQTSTIFMHNYDASTNTVTFEIGDGGKDGWYLMPIRATASYYPETEDNVKAAWFWSPTNNKWIGASSNIPISQEDQQIHQQAMNDNYLWASMEFGGYFVYISHPSKLRGTYMEYTDQEFEDTLSNIKLSQGWNMFAIHPKLAGKSLSEIKGDCNIVKVASWSYDSQQWIVFDSSMFNTFMDTPIRESSSGEVYLLKPSEDCHLGLQSGGISVPPTIPN